MSVFEEIEKTKRSQQMLSMPDAFTAVALTMSAVDGDIDDTEMECVGIYIQRMTLFKAYDEEKIASMFARLINILDRQGALFLIKSAKVVLPVELRETAFACAVDVAFADGVLSNAEKKLLKELYRFLEISEEIANMIIQVAMIRNRGYGEW